MRIAMSTVCLFLAIGCPSNKSRNSSTQLDEIKKSLSTHHLLIGRKSDARLEFLSMTSMTTLETVTFSKDQELPNISIEIRKEQDISSSDGQWLAHCKQSECNIIDKQDHTKSFTISLQLLLTPVYVSPDQTFVFFVREAPVWRSPARCSLEDERDVIVRDVVARREAIGATVCGGFPYGSLRWYRAVK